MASAKFETWFASLPLLNGMPPAFATWMAAVDTIIEKKTGLTSSDLPDYLYVDDYEDGATPARAAKAAIKAAKDY